MLLLFIDETSDKKFKEYYGICCAVINSNFYKKIKNDFQKILVHEGWNPDVEFKGSLLFSASKGDCSVSIEKRIDIASKILDLNISKHNARIKFYYVKLTSTDFKNDYLTYLPKLLEKALPLAKKGQGKDIISLHCDQRDGISQNEIQNSVTSIIAERGYTLLENITISKSCFHTVGILFADIVAYLISRIDTISNDSELFDNIPPEDLNSSGKIRKLKSSMKLLDLVKKIQTYKVPA